MFKSNKIIKFLTAAAFAVVGIGTANAVSQASTVQASAFHYLRNDHKLVTFGYAENLPVRYYYHGKHVYMDDDPSSDQNYTDHDLIKTHGWKYINNQKYYKIYDYSTDCSAYIAAKYFTKKYNDLSYEQIYTVTKAFSPRNGDMQASKTNLTLTKGANIEVDMYSKDDDIVSMSSPINSKYGLKGVLNDGGHNMSMWLKMTQSQFKNNCRKAAPNAKFVMNNAGDYETNASLARGGIYHKGHFYKVYTR
ncbi:hypothetical protein [Lactobacillus crispatus]|uniref:hypothetical protein n=1 Tax=Lactobacillus crispatus TaxID=47770 RepID=UPI000B5D9AB0|nr:hypothetical protein [Lactobacillus crispatus]OXC30414.1 hypothetical protein AYP85_00325 [Lactobacillus crispatus]OXC34926.1 hypothetical protein AYP88_05530 [Lactobacillus crispatus]